MEHQINDAAAKRNLKAWKRYNHAKDEVTHNHRLDNTIGCQLLMKQGIKAVNAKMLLESIATAQSIVVKK